MRLHQQLLRMQSQRLDAGQRGAAQQQQQQPEVETQLSEERQSLLQHQWAAVAAAERGASAPQQLEVERQPKSGAGTHS